MLVPPPGVELRKRLIEGSSVIALFSFFCDEMPYVYYMSIAEKKRRAGWGLWCYFWFRNRRSDRPARRRNSEYYASICAEEVQRRLEAPVIFQFNHRGRHCPIERRRCATDVRCDASVSGYRLLLFIRSKGYIIFIIVPYRTQ